MQDAQTLRRNFLWNTFGQLTYMLCQFLCGILAVSYTHLDAYATAEDVSLGDCFSIARLLAEHGHKIGVSHIQRVKRALAELPAEQPCDGKAIAQRDVLGLSLIHI